MSTYLVVADRASWSMGLARELSAIGDRDPEAAFVVLVPADVVLQGEQPAARLVAEEAAARARTSLLQHGLNVLEATAGPAPPRKALEEELHRGAHRYDGIIVGASRRNPGLQIQPELAAQLQRRYGIPVQLISLQGATMN